MSSKIIFSIIFFLINQFAFCQNEKLIHGKILVKDASPQGVLIINLMNEKETVSNEKGEFSIEAKIDDLLIFPSNHLDYQRKIIEEEDYKLGSIKIEMTSKITQLEDVKITTYPQFDAFKMGIISKPIKELTLAERRLRSGRGTFKDLAIEKEIALLDYLITLYENDYYIKKLKINPILVKGFQYYAVQDRNMALALRSKNKALISFILLQLSMDYNFLQQSNKPQKEQSTETKL